MSEPTTRFEAAETFFAVIDRLLELPEDPDDIAQVLKAEGIKGSCNNPFRCALALYADKSLPDGEVAMTVFGDNLHLDYGDDITFVWNFPEHLHLFTKAFDHGDYPEISDGAPRFRNG